MKLDEEIIAFYNNSRAAYHRGDISTAETWYRRIRSEHGCELFYEVELPVHLKLVHPIGCVLGRANYGDYLVAYQGSGVGSDVDGNKPTIGDGVVLFPGARILGNARVGNNVWVTANTVIYDVVVPDNVIVFPQHQKVYTSFKAAPRESVGCGWRGTKRSVKQQFFGAK